MARHFGVSRQVGPRCINPEAPCDAPFEGWPDFNPDSLTVNSETIMGWAGWFKTIFWIIVTFLIVAMFASVVTLAFARDDGQFTNSPLKSWFDSLASGKGLCCSFADGLSVADVDWDTKDGKYRVRYQGKWVVVPDSAVVTEPNKFGPAVVWPYQDADGVTQIRCFIPGAGS